MIVLVEPVLAVGELVSVPELFWRFHDGPTLTVGQ
jgi:hypothetical protein